MRSGAWIYPWDLAAIGQEAVLAETSALGADRIAVATTYHPIATTSVRPALRNVHLAEGAVLFPADPARYRDCGITPHVDGRGEAISFWEKIRGRAEAEGLSVDAWTVTVFQPWMARRHPDTARVAAFGDPSGDVVCPSAPRFQAYLRHLVADMLEVVRPHRLMLEGLLFTPYDHGWVRPRVLVEPDPVTERLFGLCFCSGCGGAARHAGVDVDGLRGGVTRACLQALEGRPDDALLAWLEETADAYDAARVAALAGFVTDLSLTVRAVSTEVLLWAGAGPNLALADRLWPVADALFVRDAELLARLRERTGSHPSTPDLLTLLWLPGALRGPSEERFTADAERAYTAGFTECGLLSFGQVPARNLARAAAVLGRLGRA